MNQVETLVAEGRLQRSSASLSKLSDSLTRRRQRPLSGSRPSTPIGSTGSGGGGGPVEVRTALALSLAPIPAAEKTPAATAGGQESVHHDDAIEDRAVALALRGDKAPAAPADADADSADNNNKGEYPTEEVVAAVEAASTSGRPPLFRPPQRPADVDGPWQEPSPTASESHQEEPAQPFSSSSSAEYPTETPIIDSPPQQSAEADGEGDTQQNGSDMTRPAPVHKPIRHRRMVMQTVVPEQAKTTETALPAAVAALHGGRLASIHGGESEEATAMPTVTVAVNAAKPIAASRSPVEWQLGEREAPRGASLSNSILSASAASSMEEVRRKSVVRVCRYGETSDTSVPEQANRPQSIAHELSPAQHTTTTAAAQPPQRQVGQEEAYPMEDDNTPRGFVKEQRPSRDLAINEFDGAGQRHYSSSLTEPEEGSYPVEDRPHHMADEYPVDGEGKGDEQKAALAGQPRGSMNRATEYTMGEARRSLLAQDSNAAQQEEKGSRPVYANAGIAEPSEEHVNEPTAATCTKAVDSKPITSQPAHQPDGEGEDEVMQTAEVDVQRRQSQRLTAAEQQQQQRRSAYSCEEDDSPAAVEIARRESTAVHRPSGDALRGEPSYPIEACNICATATEAERRESQYLPSAARASDAGHRHSAYPCEEETAVLQSAVLPTGTRAVEHILGNSRPSLYADADGNSNATAAHERIDIVEKAEEEETVPPVAVAELYRMPHRPHSVEDSVLSPWEANAEDAGQRQFVYSRATRGTQTWPSDYLLAPAAAAAKSRADEPAAQHEMESVDWGSSAAAPCPPAASNQHRLPNDGLRGKTKRSAKPLATHPEPAAGAQTRLPALPNHHRGGSGGRRRRDGSKGSCSRSKNGTSLVPVGGAAAHSPYTTANGCPQRPARPATGGRYDTRVATVPTAAAAATALAAPSPSPDSTPTLQPIAGSGKRKGTRSHDYAGSKINDSAAAARRFLQFQQRNGNNASDSKQEEVGKPTHRQIAAGRVAADHTYRYCDMKTGAMMVHRSGKHVNANAYLRSYNDL